MAGLPLRYLMFLFGSGAMVIVFTILPVWNEYIAHNSAVFVTALTNLKLKIILILACGAVTLISIVVRRYFGGKKYFYWIAYGFLLVTIGLIFSTFAGKVLKDYQIKRLIVFMDPLTLWGQAGISFSQRLPLVLEALLDVLSSTEPRVITGSYRSSPPTLSSAFFLKSLVLPAVPSFSFCTLFL